jgi:hypothetical protein
MRFPLHFRSGPSPPYGTAVTVGMAIDVAGAGADLQQRQLVAIG